jgi:hypothetical protein
VSTVIFVAAWLTPPSFYSDVIGEKDLLFLDPASFLFFSVCAGSFVLGAALIDIFFPAQAVGALKTPSSPLLLLLTPLLIGTLISWKAITLLVENSPAIIDLIFAQQGYQIKENLDVHQPLGLSSVWLLGIIWWAMWRRDRVVLDRQWKRHLVTAAIAVALISVLTYSTLKLARGEFMPVMIGTCVLLLLRMRARSALRRRTMIRAGLIGMALVLVVLLTFSFARGADDFLAEAMAYTTASYNRLAALLSGRLQYPHAGTGVYLSSFLSYNTAFNRLLPINSIFHWPSFEDVWAAEFTSTWHAGLNGFLIWSGTFGYLFSDFGWFSPAVVFVQGAICGWAWRSVLLGRVWGLVLYPWFAFCILFWCGTNFFFDTKMVVLSLVAISMGIYERLAGASQSLSVAR